MKKGGAGAANRFMSKACHACGSPLALPYMMCEACQAIQPPTAISLFDSLGIKADFIVTMETIDQHYKAAQRQVHPDKVLGRPAQEKLWAQMHAATLNQAYQTLRDDVARGQYLLAEKGIEAAITTNDPLILQESLEKREALAEAASQDALAALHANAQADYQAAYNDVAAAFAADALQDAAKALLRLRFLQKFLAEVKAQRLQGVA